MARERVRRRTWTATAMLMSSPPRGTVTRSRGTRIEAAGDFGTSAGDHHRRRRCPQRVRHGPRWRWGCRRISPPRVATTRLPGTRISATVRSGRSRSSRPKLTSPGAYSSTDLDGGRRCGRPLRLKPWRRQDRLVRESRRWCLSVAQQVITSAGSSGLERVCCTDLDGDGDADVLSASQY
jgi:hypothetical protein